MNVLMLVSSDLDNDPRVTKEALFAHKAGHDVTVLCRSCYEQYPYQVIPLGVSRKIGTARKVFERASFMVKGVFSASSLNPDIIHAHDLDMLPLGWFLSRLRNAKLLYDAHELWTDANRGVHPGIVKLAYYLEKFLAARADAVIAVSDYRADAMVEILQIDKPYVVMNTPVYQNPQDLKPPPSLRNDLTFPRDARIVLYQGRYVAGRGLEEAILAINELPENIVFVFRGYGPIEEELRTLVDNENLGSRVYFVPPVPMQDLVRYAIGADLGMVLYRPVNRNNLYSAPNKMFEYMMAGVPIAGADIPYIRQVVISERVGNLFDPSDPQNIAEIIMQLLSNQDGLKAMSERAIAASKKYCWENEYQKLEAIYQSI